MHNNPFDLSCDSCTIRTHPLFRHLEEQELQEIMLNKITETYKRGSIVYQEGNRMKGFCCVQSGIIKIYQTGFDGKEQIIRFAKPGDIIGYRSVVSNEPACTTTEVIEEAILCHIPAEILLNLVKTNGNFAVELMKLTCKELGEANSYITDIAQKTVKERLAEILIHLDDEFGEDLQGVLKISLTREELSNIVGTATESIIRLLSEFKSLGYIEINGRKIKILDKPGLKYIANI
ncbi:MAG: Crp/Fnr family transcriptional regulator [Bacteroidetes bacterium]|nr:MAG: Crp/Fnr family transcriptional regulator [Bacteroidota bacterium]RLD72971.1 MAG: Crp/Fnr family transcriptional regulator [Bacteroidota bacterium]RLE04794.1 MAG: Crp/Fnr family transcriptional regulator [Bacteroidota bacterium]